MEKLDILLDMHFYLIIQDPVLWDGQGSVPWGKLLSSGVYAKSTSYYGADKYLDLLWCDLCNHRDGVSGQ
jgi:hypothetical protein